jgi:hypothetical protein
VIIVCNRRSFPVRLTREDFEIQQSKVPRRARFIYMLGDSTDAEIMFAWVDAAADRVRSADAAGDGSSST